MTFSLGTVQACSIGTESLEVLGFKNEKELEEALISLMKEQGIEQEKLMAA